jgi:hypothetical protein
MVVRIPPQVKVDMDAAANSLVLTGGWLSRCRLDRA